MASIKFVIIEVILGALYFALTIMATKAIDAVKKDRKDESDDDKKYYDNARHYLSWCIGIGWTLFALAIIGFILYLVVMSSGGEEAEAAKKEEKSLKKAVQKTKKDTGPSPFVKFIESALIWVSLGLLFASGILSAIAATNIGKTSDKKGYSDAIWATVLGIIPFSILMIWVIGKYIYIQKKKEQIAKYNKALERKEELLAEKKGKTEGEIAKQALAAKGVSNASEGKNKASASGGKSSLRENAAALLSVASEAIKSK